MLRLTALAAASLLVVLGAFTARLERTPVLPETPYAYSAIPLPAHLDTPALRALDNTPADNPVTDAGATLGRVLFYDVRLSQNETISCGSCHLAANGFSDPRPKSVGFNGGQTRRNSMGLAFARFYASGRFFWDERAETLEAQTLMPLQDAVEMGMTLEEAVARLEATTFYPTLFEDAFGTPEITSDRMARAMAQFVRSIVAPNARYDAARAAEPSVPVGQPLAGLTERENRGLEVFFGRGRCSTCHLGELLVGDVPINNGLDAVPPDVGAGGGRFKKGSLRNVALTAPYMHDGRFATLEEVVDHYSTGVQETPALDPRLRGPDGQPLRLDFSDAERAGLVAFLHALTDETVATDPRWSDPFALTTAAEPEAPTALRVSLAGPNPARGATALRVRLAAPDHVAVEVFTGTGQRIATLHDGPASGDTVVPWGTDGLAAGVYLVRVTTGAATAALPVTVLR